MTSALCTATISLNALAHNLQLAKQLAPTSRIIAIVKANAYGHGIEHTLQAFSRADALAVARVNEGIALRQHTDKMIFVLSGVSGAESIDDCVKHQLTPVLHTLADWQYLKNSHATVTYWLKIDSGMHRLGLAFSEFQTIAASKDSLCQGLITHLSDAEFLDKPKTTLQLQEFEKFRQLWPELPCSMANSAGLTLHKDSHFQWVRPGLMLYGLSPAPSCLPALQTVKPAMALHAKVIAIHNLSVGDCVGYNGRWQATKNSTIATVAMGYADGYPRHAKDGTPVYINGKTYPLAGTVSMDLITVDVTDGDVCVGDIAELWGENISANTIAQYADTISYTLLTGISARVQRHYQTEFLD